ncbi:acetolactate synthase 2 small subunit [Enterobacteriaceae bacterium LUAb1]
MNQHQLSVEASFRPEILERILRVIRHRGFQVCMMNMVSSDSTNRITIDLTVVSHRPVSLLLTQLNKLTDVVSAQVRPTITQQIRAHA